MMLEALKTWIELCGERSKAPKDYGVGMMISAFQSREFGFRVVVSLKQQLNQEATKMAT